MLSWCRVKVMVADEGARESQKRRDRVEGGELRGFPLVGDKEE